MSAPRVDLRSFRRSKAIVTLEQIRQARERIRRIIVHTPVLRFREPAGGIGLHLKLESLQPIGSFKLRGAYNKIATLADEERRRGVITYSSGNHAQGVAYAARALDVKATVVMPRAAPQNKIDNTRRMGAEIVLVGPASSERQAKAEELSRDRGLAIIPPFNDPEIVAGQGTIALEILEDLPVVDTILAPVGGGGLISGIAAAVKLSGANVRVIGVEPELANDAQQSFRAGRLVQMTPEETARTPADGLRTQSVGQIPFQHIRTFVDDIITVTEDEIREAMRRLLSGARIVAEPSGAVSVAAMLFHRSELPPAHRLVAVVSGGNVDPALLAEIASPN